MATFFKTRNTLKNILQTHTDLAKETKVNDDVIKDVIENLKHGEMSVAVVGQVNRGKSTFLNALMGTKLFPSRASVCTAPTLASTLQASTETPSTGEPPALVTTPSIWAATDPAMR